MLAVALHWFAASAPVTSWIVISDQPPAWTLTSTPVPSWGPNFGRFPALITACTLDSSWDAQLQAQPAQAYS